MFPLKDNIPTRRFPILTVAFIVANVIVFFGFQGFLSGEEKFNDRVVKFGAIPYEITNPGSQCTLAPGGEKLDCGDAAAVEKKTGESFAPTWLTFLTSIFMHGGLLHLAGNMLFLWIFGNNVEDSMGRGRFALFYLLGGIAAVFAETLIDPGGQAPMIGASGAVAAVLGGYALLYPRARVVTLFFLVVFFAIRELPALVVLGLWFGLQAVSGAASLVQPVGEASGGVAYFAHIGGFLFGLLLIRLFANNVHKDYESAHTAPAY